MEILCCPLQLLGWAPGRLRSSWPPLLLIVPPTTCTRDRAGVCARAVDFPARELWPASHCPLEGMEGRPDGFALGFGLPHCMLGPSSYPPTHPSPSSGPQRVDGELRYRNSQRNGVGIVYSLITLNKEGPLTGSRPYCLVRLGFWEPAEWGACDASR